MTPHRFDLFDLDLDLGKSSFDEHFGVAAWAVTAVAHIEQLFDVTKAGLWQWAIARARASQIQRD